MPNDLSLLIGYWVLDSAPERSHEIGVTHIRFTDDGLLQEGNENEWRIYVLSFQYWVEGDAVMTICPPNPRTEMTPFSIISDEKLALSFGDEKTIWIRTEKKEFFESSKVWNPGFLFERQTDYMSMLDLKPHDYEIEGASRLGMSPQIFVNTNALWKCWKYGRSSFASFHLEDFEQILERGVLIDREDDMDRTLLSYLAEDGLTQAVQMAADYGADVNNSDVLELTALDYAILANRTETAEALRKLGGTHGKGFSELE
jgi:hypothetical protein